MKTKINDAFRKVRYLWALLVAFCLMATLTHAAGSGSTHVSLNNTAPALDIYNGYTGTLTVAIVTNGAAMTVTADGLATSVALNGSGTNNIKWLIPKFTAITNSDGDASLVVDANMSLDSDLIVTNLLSGTYTAANGQWLSIPWNTTNANLQNLYIPSGGPFFERDGDEIRARRTPLKCVIDEIFGEASGTGNLTVSVYVDRTNLVYYKTYQSPRYELGTIADGTGIVTNAVINLVDFRDNPSAVIGSQGSAFIRLHRATTTTSPNLLGAHVSQTP